MTLQPYFDKLNYYDATGKPGTNPQITSKDWAKAILSGELTTKVPEVCRGTAADEAGLQHLRHEELVGYHVDIRFDVKPAGLPRR